MKRRILVNLLAFAAVSTVVIAWSFTTLFEVDALDDPDFVTAEFESSPGLARGFEVAYLGHAVGSIHSVELRDGFSEVVLKINRGEELPAAIDADARRKSAIGEPFVDLSPTEGTDPAEGPRLADGDRIPVERTSSPISYGTLFKSVDALLAAVEPEQVGIVVEELATALDGRGDDLRRIISGSRDLTERTVANGAEIDQFLVDIRDLTGVLADERDALARSIDSFDAVTATLEESSGSLDRLLTDGPSALRLIARIVAETDAQLACTVDGLAVLGPVTEDGVAEALRGTIADAGTALEVTNGAIGEDGYLNLTLLLSDVEGAVIYPERRPPPVAPAVAACPDLAGEAVSTPAGPRARPGAGGRGGAADEEAAVEGRPADPEGTGRTGSSELDEPDDPLLAKIMRVLVPLLVLAALAGAGWFLWRHLRGPDDDGPGEGPAPLEEGAPETAGR